MDWAAMKARRNAQAELSDVEQDLYDAVIAALNGVLPDGELRPVRRSDDYVSVLYRREDNDFLRFKASPRTLWVSIAMTPDMIKRLQTDERFDAQKNKKTIHWKSKLDSIQAVDALADVMAESAISYDRNLEAQFGDRGLL